MTVIIELIILLPSSALFCRSNFCGNNRFSQTVGLVKCRCFLLQLTTWVVSLFMHAQFFT